MDQYFYYYYLLNLKLLLLKSTISDLHLPCDNLFLLSWFFFQLFNYWCHLKIYVLKVSNKLLYKFYFKGGDWCTWCWKNDFRLRRNKIFTVKTHKHVNQSGKTFFSFLFLALFLINLNIQLTSYALTLCFFKFLFQTFQAFQKDASLKEMEEKLKQSRNDNAIHMELLERLVEDGNTEILDFVISSNDPISESQASSRSNSPVDR